MSNSKAHKENPQNGPSGGSPSDCGVEIPLNTHAIGSQASQKPRRTVLVLGGGGMRGFCHIGIVRAIERLGLQIDEIVGTSMGAVMGGLLAGGKSPRYVNLTLGISMVFTIRKWKPVIFEKTVYKMVWQKPF